MAIAVVGEVACSFPCFDTMEEVEDTWKEGTSLEELLGPDWTLESLYSIFLIEVDMGGHSFLGVVA